MKRLLTALLLLSGCPKADREPPAPANLASEVRRALAERDRRLTTFRLTVETTQGADVAKHEVAFRSPNKSRGHLLAPVDLELAFDGQHLLRLKHAEKRVEQVELALPPAERALFLASTFMPFVPEGFRTPPLPSQVEAKRVSHPRAPEAVEVRATPEPGVAVTWVLRLPSGDFVEKRTEANGSTKHLAVTAERCDDALKLCVPTTLVETLDGQPLGTTVVKAVELNPELPQDHFAPRPPDGYEVVQQKLQP